MIPRLLFVEILKLKVKFWSFKKFLQGKFPSEILQCQFMKIPGKFTGEIHLKSKLLKMPQTVLITIFTYFSSCVRLVWVLFVFFLCQEKCLALFLVLSVTSKMKNFRHCSRNPQKKHRKITGKIHLQSKLLKMAQTVLIIIFTYFSGCVRLVWVFFVNKSCCRKVPR